MKKKLLCLILAGLPAVLAAQPGFPPNDPDSWRVAGTAKILCSALFVSGRDSAEARAHVTPYFLGPMVDSITKFEVDRRRKLVRLTVANRLTREAKLYGDQGCIIHQPGKDSIFFKPVRVASRLPNAATTPWPMGDVVPTTPLPAEIDTAKLRQAVDAAFATPEGFTAAFVVVHKGRIVAERYGAGANRDMQLESWSMGKSIAGTWIGMLVHQGVLKLDDPAPVPAWQKTPGDPRAKIRVIDLMRMSSGLRYSRGSPEDVPGYHDHDLGYTGAIDSYAFATSVPPQFEPNTFGRYRNSDPLTLGMIVRDAVRKRGEEYLTWPQRALFDKIGIRRQVLETDPYGNFLIPGYDYGTARNWARIGMLYLNDGMWQGERLLPEGWTKFVSTPAPAWKDSAYGAMVWVNARGAWPELPRDAFAFRGAGLQDTYVIPSRDLVIVRMGHFVGSRAGTVNLRRANTLLMEAIPERRGGSSAASPTTLMASQPANPRVDSIFATFAKRDSPGCAVAVVNGGQTVFAKGYGMASLEHDLPITPTSAFYAASVSKQFTAFAVAMLAQQGKLSLDDDIRKWIPEVPNFGKTITVRHLIHHTSGLRDYFGLLGMTGWPGDGPITEARFLDLVSRQKALNFDPGARHLYSNTGYVLLSILVKRVSGQSLREFSDQAMFAPLGMSNSRFRDDHTMLVKNRAMAYSPRAGGWQMNVPGFDVVGDGGLFTTVEDLAKWARNSDDHTVGGDELAARVLTRGRLTSGDSIPYAYGLAHNVYRGQPVIEHGGAYGGYRTHLLRFPAQRFAVATLCNTSTANAAQLSQAVATVYLGDRLAPATQVASSNGPTGASTVRLSQEQLTRYAGAYWDAKNESLRRIEVRDSVLALPGTPILLLPVSETSFRASTANATIAFMTQRDGSLVLEETAPSGEKSTYQRMSPPKTDARTLAEFAGSYVSDELDTTWRIEVRDGVLLLRRGAVPDITLQPVFLDAFNSPGGVVRFVRASNGRVTGLVIGAGRVTGFVFRRT